MNLLGVSTSIAAVLVYLGLPGALIGPFTKYALGTKSVVYKAAQQEEKERLEAEAPKAAEMQNVKRDNLEYELAKVRHAIDWDNFIK